MMDAKSEPPAPTCAIGGDLLLTVRSGIRLLKACNCRPFVDDGVHYVIQAGPELAGMIKRLDIEHQAELTQVRVAADLSDNKSIGFYGRDASILLRVN